MVPNGALHVEKRGGHLKACTLEEIIGRVKQFRVLQHRSVKYARLFRELAFAVLVMVTFHSHFDRVESNELNHAIVSSLVAPEGGGFMAIDSHEGVFTWLADTLVPTVFPTTDYNQNDVLLKRGTTSGTRFLQYNKVLPAAAAGVVHSSSTLVPSICRTLDTSHARCHARRTRVRPPSAGRACHRSLSRRSGRRMSWSTL